MGKETQGKHGKLAELRRQKSECGKAKEAIIVQQKCALA